MGLRPGRCYRELKGEAYTRRANKVMKKAFVRGIPGARIRLFDMGNKEKREWKMCAEMFSSRPIQLRHNQLEAMRMLIFKGLTDRMNKAPFFFRIRAYPHQILRENALATGAGADRFQQGMKHAFGKPIGVAARLKANRPLLSVYVDDETLLPIIKDIFRLAKNKLSGSYTFKVSSGPCKI
jgi:large subunit ribosomal protein L10e